MSVLIEKNGAGSFIVSEANGTRSRSSKMFALGSSFVAGEVVQLDGASGEMVKYVPESGAIAGVCFASTDATDTAVAGVVITRDAEVSSSELVWPAGVSAGIKASAVVELGALGIVVLEGK